MADLNAMLQAAAGAQGEVELSTGALAFTSGQNTIPADGTGSFGVWSIGAGPLGTGKIENNKFTLPVDSISVFGLQKFRKVIFHPEGTAIALIHGTAAPYVTAFEWSSLGFGAKFSDPSPAISGFQNGGFNGAFKSTGNYIAITFQSNSSIAPGLNVYGWSNSGFGTKYLPPTQNVGLTGYGVAWNFAGNAIAFCSEGSPFINVHSWSDSTQFGAKFSNPSSLPPGTAFGVAFHPSDNAIAVAHAGSPSLTVYAWSNTTGFGTKYTNPTTLPGGSGRSVQFHPTGNAIILAHDNNTYISAYPWSGAGFGAKFNNPVPAINGNGMNIQACEDVAFSPENVPLGAAAGSMVAIASRVGQDNFPRTYFFSTATGFGSLIPSPIATYASSGAINRSVAWCPVGDPMPNQELYFITGQPGNNITTDGYARLQIISGCGFESYIGSPFVGVPAGLNGNVSPNPVLFSGTFTRSVQPPGQSAVAVFANPFTGYLVSTNGWGSALTTTPFVSGITNMAANPNGTAIAMSANSSPYVHAYAWSSAGWGTKYSNPSSLLPAGGAHDVDFHPNNDAVAFAHAGSPFVTVYAWSDASGFGTKFANPTSALAGIGTVLKFNPAGDVLAIGHVTSPNLTAYSWSASGFGFKYGAPSPGPGTNPGTTKGMAWHPDGNAIFVDSQSTSPYFMGYIWSNSTGFGTRYGAPSAYIACRGTAVVQNGKMVVNVSFVFPYCRAWLWSSSGFIGPLQLGGSALSLSASFATPVTLTNVY